MKPTPHILRRGATICLLAACLSVFASRSPRLPALSDVVDTWSGYSNHNDFLRLELDKDGAGYLSFLSVAGHDSPPKVYRVHNWTLSDWSIVVKLQPLTRGAEPLQFKQIHFGYLELECEFGGKGWDRKATLYSERTLRERGESAQKAIAAERKKQR